MLTGCSADGRTLGYNTQPNEIVINVNRKAKLSIAR